MIALLIVAWIVVPVALAAWFIHRANKLFDSLEEDRWLDRG